VHQARTEARAEAEAAAEQRIAAALALERTELDKQARSWLCMCRSRLHRLSQVLQQMCTTDCERDGCICFACGSMGHGVVELSWEQACVSYWWLCSADWALPSAQVHHARAAARAEAEAAAEQRLAALDQARREEREAVVRVALALGAGRVGAPPGTPLCVPFTTHRVTDTPSTQAATEHTRTVPWHRGCALQWAAQLATVPCLARAGAPPQHAVRQCAVKAAGC